MEDIILSVIAEAVLKKIVSLAVSEISSMFGVKEELKRLGDTLSIIRAVLLDAEEQQTKKHGVKEWLERLKDVVYDMDDVLDVLSTEALRRKEVGNSNYYSCFSCNSNPIAFRFKIVDKIKDIREKLDHIAADRRNFNLTEQVVNNNNAQFMINLAREQSHSFVVASSVIGRKEDKDKLVELLVSSEHMDLSVIPIVGLGGLGKTTLAKLVYNDDKVVQSFEVKLWACVSEDSRMNKVVEKIIKSSKGASCDGLDMDQLQNHLRDILFGKRFILVLDDIWNDDPKWWTELKNLLVGGANGSIVIVTTRSLKIGSIVGTTPSFNLSKLPLDDCLSLFWKCAFHEGIEKNYPQLIKIGKEIVSKCGGVPLAIKTLGSLLYMKTDVIEWSYIKDNDIWRLKQKENDIMPALRLSYEQLPSYLKQCFAYCSIFPKDYEIGKHELINLWIAQGLLQSLDIDRQLEDIGSEYFNELLSRSFFDDVVRSFDSAVFSFKMHDLVHDLARLVAGTEFVDVNNNSKVLSERVRHLIYNEDNLYGKKFPRSLVSAKKVRSFTFALYVGPISKRFLDTLLKSFISLRVLDLSNSEFEVLPKFIGKLQHLRYLNLSGNTYIRALPNAICKLQNLQFLYLTHCQQLQDLPRDFTKLRSLRYIILTSNLISIRERGLKGLTSLRYLRVVGCNRLESFPDGVGHLTSLREFEINECGKLASFPSGMNCLASLEVLVISDCQELNLFEGNDLQGLRSLRVLTIRGLPKLVTLPHGLLQSAATLQYINIDNCRGLTRLPEWLHALTSLQVLYVDNCPSLLSLPKGMERLTALSKLSIEGSPHLIKRCDRETGEDWPHISHIPQIFR